MKAEQTPGDDGGLRQVLKEWKVEAPLPPRFQEAVWRRIEQAETAAKPGLWPRVGVFLASGLRPKLALVYAAVLLIAGVAGGSFAAQAATRRMNADLSLRYVQTIDPYRAGASVR